MHDFVTEEGQVLDEIAAWIGHRISGSPRVEPYCPDTIPEITPEGIGAAAAWRALRDAVLPTAFPTDHPRYLAFVGGAPTAVAVLADAALSAASVYGGSELEAGQVVAAERAALRWLCTVVGYPDTAHGTFCSGGSMANLSALVAARHRATATTGHRPGLIVAGGAAHSSVTAAAEIMGCSVAVAGSAEIPLTGAQVESVLAGLDPGEVVAVVATAGATNTGAVDRLDEVAEVCARYAVWLHVDAAYGGAALLAPACRDVFRGLERADSVTIDPHKWLFTPYDCAAVLYRDPGVARAAHAQRAPYLDAVSDLDADNPADYAVHLSRRPRGVPLWTSLVAHGTDAYVDAIETCLAVAGYAAKRIEADDALELVAGPSLSVVLFARRGWEDADYVAWSQWARRTGLCLVTPTSHAGRTVLRLCFVNPTTTRHDVDVVLGSVAGHPHGSTGCQMPEAQ